MRSTTKATTTNGHFKPHFLHAAAAEAHDQVSGKEIKHCYMDKVCIGYTAPSTQTWLAYILK